MHISSSTLSSLALLYVQSLAYKWKLFLDDGFTDELLKDIINNRKSYTLTQQLLLHNNAV